MRAVFIDGVRNQREMHVPDARPEYLFPIPRRFFASWPSDPSTFIEIPIARFAFDCVRLDGTLVYRWVATT